MKSMIDHILDLIYTTREVNGITDKWEECKKYFQMDKYTYLELLQLKDDAGTYILNQQLGTLVGYPIVIVNGLVLRFMCELPDGKEYFNELVLGKGYSTVESLDSLMRPNKYGKTTHSNSGS